jgi:hypothetical protein
MSCESEIITAVINAINADTGAGGLMNTSSAAYVRDLTRDDDPNGDRAASNWPSVIVSCSSQSSMDPFGSGAYMADVRLRIKTDMDTGFTNLDAVCARLRTVLHRVTFTAGSTYGFSAFRIVRWQRLAPINVKEMVAVADCRVIARKNSGV